jgi:hypothetical protein
MLYLSMTTNHLPIACTLGTQSLGNEEVPPPTRAGVEPNHLSRVVEQAESVLRRNLGAGLPLGSSPQRC